MNILVIGSGGREHAICWAFVKSGQVTRPLVSAPGNGGIAEMAECASISSDDLAALADLAFENRVDLTFVGGESPLALGIVDEFESRGLKIIGPCQKAARLEASKSFAKDFMRRHGVPTADYEIAGSVEEAISILGSEVFGGPDTPVVVKADGLAAGKGVIVAASRQEAVAALESLANTVGKEAVSRIVLEECLTGDELSLLMFVDGEDFSLMPPARDHKRLGEGDVGPNTGGMGTFTDDSLLSSEQLQRISETIIRPTLQGCIYEGFPFRGILFLGLMMTARGPKLLEYNVRFGDPETQSILVRLETDLVEVCEAMIEGRLKDLNVSWKPGSSATVVLAAEGYPQNPRKGDLISGLEGAAAVPGVTIFHAGTSKNDGRFVTSGGRVLGVTAVGQSMDESLRLAYSAAEKISFTGMQYRRDIGRTVSNTAGTN